MNLKKNNNIEYIFKKQKHFNNHLKISHAYLTLLFWKRKPYARCKKHVNVLFCSFPLVGQIVSCHSYCPSSVEFCKYKYCSFVFIFSPSSSIGRHCTYHTSWQHDLVTNVIQVEQTLKLKILCWYGKWINVPRK